jgi:hypothetical protein
MESFKNIVNIINSKKEYLNKGDYKAFNNTVIGIISNKLKYKVLVQYFIRLINIIDNIKDNITDSDYLLYMNSLSKLEEHYKNLEENYNDDHYYDDNDINIIDVEKFVEIFNNNNTILMNFIKDNNLSEDFINSTFNIVYDATYNYINNNTCKCINENNICYYYSDNNYINCKNIQMHILNNPLNFLIYKQLEHFNINKIIEDINKYKLFSFDGKINCNLNNINKINIISNLQFNVNLFEKIIEDDTFNIQILQYINIYYIMCNYGYIILREKNLRKLSYLKLMTEIIKPGVLDSIEYWASLLNFNNNIFNIIIENYKKLFPDLIKTKIS